MNNNKISYRIVLLGNSGLGKTSIICRYINNSFDSNSIRTNGATYTSKEIILNELENKKIIFDIWDTAGKEKFYL